MILKIVLKNLKIILRNPFTLILLILVPILLMLIIGFSYSSSQLNNVDVGLIAKDNSFFKKLENEVNFKYYYFNSDPNSQIKNCVNQLKYGSVDFCVYSDFSYSDDGNIEKAKIIYYIDNTRGQLSQIMINSFDNYIDIETQKISKDTINSIIVEINNTFNLITENKKYFDNVLIELNNADNDLKSFIVIYKDSNNKFQSDYLSLKTNLESFNNEINNNQNYLNEINEKFEILTNNVDYSINTLKDIEKTISNLEKTIIFYSQNNSDISNYININDIYNLKTSLNNVISSLEDNQLILNKLDLDNNNNNNKLISSLNNNIITEFDSLSNYLNEGETNLDELSNLISRKNEEIKILNNNLTTKLNYFEDLSNRDAKDITEPIIKKNHLLFENFQMVHKLAPSIVILVLLFIGLLLSNIIVSLEINSKAYFRNLLAPISQVQYLIALFITSFIIIMVQITFLLLILYTNFGIFSNLLLNPDFITSYKISVLVFLFLIVAHLVTIFILIGIFIAYFVTSLQVSILVTTFLMLFMFLFSGVVVPIEIMPSSIFNVIKLNPVVIGEDLIRKIFYFNLNLVSFKDFIIFYLYILSFIYFIYLASKRRIKKLF